MLEILAGSDLQSLDLGKISINFVLNSPIFTETDGSGSYNFTLPPTAKNKKFFNFPHRVTGNNPVVTETCQVKFSGRLLFTGIINVVESTEDGFECAIGMGKGNFYYDTKDVLLNDIDYGSKYYNSKATLWSDYLATFSNYYPDGKFTCFPLKNLDYCKGLSSTIDTNFRNNIQYLNYYSKYGYFDSLPNNYLLITPFFYLNFVLEKLFENYNYFLEKNFLRNDSELNKLVLLNNSTSSIFKQNISGGFDLVGPLIPFTLDYKNFIPNVNIIDFIKALEKTFNLSIHFKNNKIKILKNNDILNSSDVIDFTNDVYSFKIKNNNIINNILFQFNLQGDDYATDKVKEIENKYTYKGSHNNVSDLPPSGNDLFDYRYIIYDDAFYYWNYDQDTGTHAWILLTLGLNPLRLNDLIENIQENETTLSPIYAIREEDAIDKMLNPLNYRSWLIPIMLGAGTSLYNPAENEKGYYFNDNILKLLFYRGFQKDSKDYLYPLGTYDVYNYDRDIIGGYSLKWDGEYGIYEKFYKDWSNWILNTRKEITFNKSLSITEIQNIDFSNKYRIENFNILISRISLTITNETIQPAEIEAYTC